MEYLVHWICQAVPTPGDLLNEVSLSSKRSPASPSLEEVMGITQLVKVDRTRLDSLLGLGGPNSPLGIPFQKERPKKLCNMRVLGPERYLALLELM